MFKRSQRLLRPTLRAISVLAGLCLFPEVSRADGVDDGQPSPPSIGADIPVTYFGPPPSEVQRELIGPYQLLKAGQIDLEASTITLPLYRGQSLNGKSVWYVLTDTTDEKNAAALGLNFSAKLAYAATCRGARDGMLETDGSLTFAQGAVDFAPVLTVVPGDAPKGFPPKVAKPGAIGDAGYSPLVRILNAGGHVYNAPIVAYGVEAKDLAFCDGNPDYSRVHDRVVKICASRQTVTLKLNAGFSFARPVLYLSMDSNDEATAAIEGVTLAPGLNDVLVGRDDSFASGVERLFTFANGPINPSEREVNPQRQGLSSALLDKRSPLNVIGGIPTIATDYSPLWDVNVGEWTDEAIRLGYRSRLTEEFQILGFVVEGWLTGPGGKAFGSSGAIVNCPIAYRFL